MAPPIPLNALPHQHERIPVLATVDCDRNFRMRSVCSSATCVRGLADKNMIEIPTRQRIQTKDRSAVVIAVFV